MSIRKVRNEPAQLPQFQYQAHASNISDMHLVINRRPKHQEMTPQPSRQLDNPYVFKPKSYSTKRNNVLDMSDKHPRLTLGKKIKKENLISKEASSELIYELNQIIQQTQKGTENYFTNVFFSKTKLQDENNSETLFGINDNLNEKKLNPMIKNQITIVSNKNQKIPVSIHEGLLLANTSHTKLTKDQHFLKNVANPFDYERRDYYLKNIKFEKDYKNGYAPIQMQQNNVQEPEEGNNNQNTKTHYIRKKQSTLSLPRSCGVSYLKPSQSTQGEPFQPLPPLIFQCSSRCIDNKVSKDKFSELSNLFNNFSQESWIPFILSNEDQMRDLLLGQRRGQVGWVKGIQNLWPLFTEGNFFLLIYSQQKCQTQQKIWEAFGNCPFKIGILAKKSTSGKKAFLKSLNIKQCGQQDGKQEKYNDEKHSVTQNFSSQKVSKQNSSQNNHEERKATSLEQEIAYQLKDCRTVITLSLRLQMYVEEKQWKNSPKEVKDMLNFIITSLKDNLQKFSLQIIKKRFTLAKSQCKDNIVSQIATNIRVPIEKSLMINQRLKQSSIIFSEQQLISLFKSKYSESKSFQKDLSQNTQTLTLENILKINKSQAFWEKNLKMPLYYISTRDSFAFDLVEKISFLKRQNGKIYKKIQYYFEPDNLPTNYGKQYKEKFPELNVGITSYHDFFTNEQLNYFQNNTFGTEIDAFKSKYLQMTVQPSIVGNKIKRTKFFFGYRYMWTRCQLAQPGSYIGAGVRRDVTPPPKWTQTVIDQFVKNQIAQKDFINSIAINVYHDGKQGLAQHFDDAVRFKQPIYTVRLFSDARLSFGSQFYGFCNGAFIIPLPRGCICVMEENSYAANGVKHCVRPCDMTGKSAAIILRQMHSKVVGQSTKYDELIDFPAWISTLSDKSDAITFAEQKRRQAEYLLANSGKEEIAK